jgi:hypothetical protein
MLAEGIKRRPELAMKLLFSFEVRNRRISVTPQLAEMS